MYEDRAREALAIAQMDAIEKAGIARAVDAAMNGIAPPLTAPTATTPARRITTPQPSRRPGGLSDEPEDLVFADEHPRRRDNAWARLADFEDQRRIDGDDAWASDAVLRDAQRCVEPLMNF